MVGDHWWGGQPGPSTGRNAGVELALISLALTLALSLSLAQSLRWWVERRAAGRGPGSASVCLWLLAVSVFVFGLISECLWWLSLQPF